MEHKETIHSEDRLNAQKSLVPPPKRSAAAVKSAFVVEVRVREALFRHPARQKSASASPTKNSVRQAASGGSLAVFTGDDPMMSCAVTEEGDFAVPVSKGKYDQTQFFNFSGGATF